MSSFFSCRRQILEITQVRKLGLHCVAHFASVSIPRFIIFLLHKYSTALLPVVADTMTRQLYSPVRQAHSLPLSAKKIFFKIKFWKQFGPPSDRRRRMEGCANLAVKSKPSVRPRQHPTTDLKRAVNVISSLLQSTPGNLAYGCNIELGLQKLLLFISQFDETS